MDAREVLIEFAGRPLAAAQTLHGLPAEALNRHPAGHPNSPAWLLWHAGREIDLQLADLSGGEQVWTHGGFARRSGLGVAGDDLGLGHTPEQARAIEVEDAGPLLEYLAEVTDALRSYVRSLAEEDLDVVVDDSWDPPTTRGVRLVSMIDDAAQHLGQAAYAVGAPDAS
ncbi:DinB family protein [Brevibacterium sp.]|uniref:mycothiol transferase n=1 Tax=Brevibacterium sp. TaxID=1701 RepID=UPI0025BC8FD6|nr:DinB family protein [Brevibacterium sp.]